MSNRFNRLKTSSSIRLAGIGATPPSNGLGDAFVAAAAASGAARRITVRNPDAFILLPEPRAHPFNTAPLAVRHSANGHPEFFPTRDSDEQLSCPVTD
jgi:hypothetical protein